MPASSIDYTFFFCHPNIHPLKEHERRKSGNIRFAEPFGVPFVDGSVKFDQRLTTTPGECLRW